MITTGHPSVWRRTARDEESWHQTGKIWFGTLDVGKEDSFGPCVPSKIKIFKPHPTEHDRRARYDHKRRQDPGLAQAARFRSSSAWQKVRRLKREANPICEDPYGDHQHEGRDQASEGIHHVISLQDEPGLGLVLGNLRSLCWRCHNRVDDFYDQNPTASIRLFMDEKQEQDLRAGVRGAGASAPTGEGSAGQLGGDHLLDRLDRDEVVTVGSGAEISAEGNHGLVQHPEREVARV